MIYGDLSWNKLQYILILSLEMKLNNATSIQICSMQKKVHCLFDRWYSLETDFFCKPFAFSQISVSSGIQWCSKLLGKHLSSTWPSSAQAEGAEGASYVSTLFTFGKAPALALHSSPFHCTGNTRFLRCTYQSLRKVLFPWTQTKPLLSSPILHLKINPESLHSNTPPSTDACMKTPTKTLHHQQTSTRKMQQRYPINKFPLENFLRNTPPSAKCYIKMFMLALRFHEVLPRN